MRSRGKHEQGYQKSKQDVRKKNVLCIVEFKRERERSAGQSVPKPGLRNGKAFFNMRAKTMVLCIFIISGVLIMLGGCSNLTLYQSNMTEERRTNLLKDLEALRPARPVDLPDPLTLDNAVKIGMVHNLNLRISRRMAEIADDNALIDRLKMLPQLNVSGNLSQSSVYSVEDEDKTQKTASISLVWSVLDFGLSYIRARQAVMKTEIQRMERLRQAQSLAMDITTAYWKAVLAEQSLEQIRKIEAEVQDYKTEAESLVAEKRLDPIASKAIEKKLVELAITASNLQAEISGAKIELCKLMGVDPTMPFNLKREDFRDYVSRMPVPESLDPKKMENISLRNRPEFFAADIELKVQQDAARAALLSMFPGISMSFSSYYNGDSHNVNNFWHNWGANIASSLLSLPSQYVSLNVQKKSEKIVELQRLLLTAGVIVQAHMAVHDYAVKEQQFKLYDDSFMIADDLLNMSRERRELGLLSAWSLTQRMLEDVVARLERDRRIINLFNAYNTLLVTLGLDYSRWGENLAETEEESVPEDIENRDINLPKETQENAPDEPEKEIEEFDISPDYSAAEKRFAKSSYDTEGKRFAKSFYEKIRKPNPDTKGKGNFPGFCKYIEKFKSLYGFGNFNSLYNFSIKAQGEGGYNV